MASSILIIIVLIFALRGFFLGVTGVIGRFAGFILGYYVSYQFQTQLATIASTQLGLNLPMLVLTIISGLLLFFGTLYLTGLAVSMAFKILGEIIPPLQAISDKNSSSAKSLGATVNASLAAFITLLIIWGVDQLRPSPPDDLVHQAAKYLGNTVIGTIDTKDWNIEKLAQFSNGTFDTNTISSMTQVLGQSSTLNNTSTNTAATIGTAPNNTLTTMGKSHSKGTATITSATDPSKSLSIETSREVIEQVLQNNPEATQQLMQSSQIQEILNNPQFRETAMQELQNNLNSGQFDPQQLEQLMNNPQLRQLLEQLGTQ